jgi:RNA polymerase sigma factor (sigma-70 family)
MSPSVSVRLLLTQSDERLLAYARAGHERAFEALVARYRRPLLGYCRRLLLSSERAEDALQQALMQAWVAVRDGAEVRDARPWLYRIVHNAAVGALRVSGYDYCKLSESLSGAGAPQEDLDRRIAVREALAGLAALPEMQREALLRTAVEGRSHQQTALELGVSEPALRGLVYRARAALRAAAGAILPPPALSWALEAGTRGAPALDRAAAVAGGGGGAGLAGLLVKGGAVAVTAGALAGGLVATHAHRSQARAAGAARAAQAQTGAAAAGGSAEGATQPAAFARPAGRELGRATALAPRAAGRGAPASQPHGPRFAPRPGWSPRPPHGDGGQQQSGSQDGRGGGSHDGFGVPGPGSGSLQQKDGGSSGQDGGTGTAGATGESGRDGSGDTSASSPGGGETSTSGDGGSSSTGGGTDGSGDTQTTATTSSGGATTSLTNDSKDGSGSTETTSK